MSDAATLCATCGAECPAGPDGARAGLLTLETLDGAALLAEAAICPGCMAHPQVIWPLAGALQRGFAAWAALEKGDGEARRG